MLKGQRMVKIKLTGGLGNQMFQYAYAKALESRGYDIELDSSIYQHYQLHGGFQLDKYAINIPIINKKTNIFLHKIKVKSGWGNRNILKEKTLLYDEALLTPKDDITIEGYFQSEKYFMVIRKLLLEQFTIQEPLSDYGNKIAKLIRENNSCSVHIRRGDYVQNASTQAVHGSCDLDYYSRAIEYMEKEYEDIDYFIFSDDITWVKEHLLINNAHYIESEEERIPHEDIYLMSLCQHNIIANSSFSWWGAWLNQYAKKQVIAPKRWFLDEVMYQQSHDIVPSHWMKT